MTDDVRVVRTFAIEHVLASRTCGAVRWGGS